VDELELCKPTPKAEVASARLKNAVIESNGTEDPQTEISRRLHPHRGSMSHMAIYRQLRPASMPLLLVPLSYTIRFRQEWQVALGENGTPRDGPSRVSWFLRKTGNSARRI